VPKVLLDSANMSAMLLYIITNAVLFSFLLTYENIPQGSPQWMVEPAWADRMFLLAVNVCCCWPATIMEPSSIILITAPILFPVAMKLGIDPIHFGVMIDGQHGDRHDHPAGRPQPLCRQRDIATRDDRDDRRLFPLAAHHAGISHDDHLLADPLPVAAADPGYDVTRCPVTFYLLVEA
jgi:hypothetical protein